DRGQAAKQIGIQPGRYTQPARRRNPHQRQNQAEKGAQQRGGQRDDQRVDQARCQQLRQDVLHCRKIKEGTGKNSDQIHSRFSVAGDGQRPSPNVFTRTPVARGLIVLRQILFRHRRARKPLLIKLFPRPILHRRFDGFVQRRFKGRFVFRYRHARRGVERGDVGCRHQFETGGIIFGGFVIKEHGINGAVVQRGDGGVVIRKAHQIGLFEVRQRIAFLQRALNDAQSLVRQRCHVFTPESLRVRIV
ncbi:hypothetical protein COLO4_02519, partial [Corchorus olitorius]